MEMKFVYPCNAKKSRTHLKAYIMFSIHSVTTFTKAHVVTRAVLKFT